MASVVEKSKRQRRFRTIKRAVLIAGVLVIAAIVLSNRGPHPTKTRSAPKTKTKAIPAPAPDLPAPRFLVSGGIFTNEISVGLTADSPSAVIRYTSDGSEPTSASRKYSAPIQIGGTTLLRVKVFGAGSSVSATVSQTYIRLSPDVEGFSSNLPLVILHSFGQQIPHDTKARVSAHFIDSAAGRATLTGGTDFDGSGDLNIRGHTSLRYPKHSYHFKTKDDDHNPLKVSLLGFPKDSDWVLYAPFPDKTLMRDVIGYELSNQMGRYASRTKFVEVFLNETGKNLSQRDYLGVFVFEEKTKRGKHRVAIEKLELDDNTEPNVTGGYIFKKDHFDSVQLGESNPGGFQMGGAQSHSFFTGPGGFPGDPEGFFPVQGNPHSGADGFFQRMSGRFSSLRFVTSHGNQFFYVEPKADEITSKQKAWLAAYLNKFETVLYGDNFKDAKTGYTAYIDPDSFIDHHLLVEATKNIDGFRFSTFYYKDRNGKVGMGPIWDWNLSFGNANGKQGWKSDGWYWPQLDDQQYSWFRRLFEDPDFGQKYVDRWGELRANQFVIAKIHARIDELAELLDEAQARNFRKWRIMGRTTWPNSYVGKSYSDEINWMKQWIQKRIEWVDRQFLKAPSFSLHAGPVDRGSPLSLSAPAGKIYYTLDGSDPRAPGGAVSASARPFDSDVVLNDDAVVFSRAHRDNRWSYPAISKFRVEQSARGN